MENLLHHRGMPELDLHGETVVTTRILVNEFLNDNCAMGLYEVAIVHGIGKGILKKEVHKVLRESKIVEEFKLDNFNSGCTLVKLSKSIDNNGRKLYNKHHNSKGDRV